MRFLKGLVVFLLLAIIIGGIGFLGYNIYMGNIDGSMFGMNMSSNNKQDTTNSDGMNMNGTSEDMNQAEAVPNPMDAQNREKMSNALDMINEALDLITIDPYSNATVPDADNSMQMNTTQGLTSQGTGTINIYPSGNSSVNITPGSGTGANDSGVTAGSQSTMGNMNNGTMNNTGGNTAGTNHVYDQTKLQQLHKGIYTIAKGILAINQLNDNLMNQSMALEQKPYTYQTYVTRYNIALRNQADLEDAMAMLDNASILINVNPYAADSGYSYNNANMKQLHDGIFKFAQGMAILESLDRDFKTQMVSASNNAQNMIYSSSQMNMSSSTGFNLFGNLNFSTILNTIIVILLIGLIIGIIGAFLNLFKNRSKISD